ncbi:MAG: hypothetical protein CML22_07285 [Rheinheimera sp.]|nr:hypothetical protein [Rheinheimera sp.]MBM34087.1 hypothetical protein [Rheinheimera sp.]|tara:strand:- start:41940 stop:42545 length:606 start_codon:yes stop_codon:yes gene_type:complete
MTIENRSKKITPISLLHIGFFFASVIAVYWFRNNTLISMVLAEVIILYVAISNINRREILPPLFICLVFKLVEYPLSLWQFGNVEHYIVMLIVFDSALCYVLLRHYRSDMLWRLFKVEVPKLPIPQVKAIATLLLLGVFHLLLVLSEVLLHVNDLVSFDGVPFFYRTFPEVRATHKVVIMLGVWSMMLDAYFHPMRRKVET